MRCGAGRPRSGHQVLGCQRFAAGGRNAADPPCGGAAVRAQPGHGIQPAQRQAAVFDRCNQRSAAAGCLLAVLPQPEQPSAAGRTHPGAGRRHRQLDRSCAERRGGGLHQPAVHAVRSVQFCRYLCLRWCGTLGAGHFPGGAARGYEKEPEGAVSHGAA